MDNYSSLVDLIIQDELKGGSAHHETILLLGDTPKLLQEHAGFPALPLAVKGKVIGKSHFDHGITSPMLKKLPAIVCNPKSIFKSANAHISDSAVVLTFEFKGDSPIIVPIHMNRQAGRSSRYNFIASVYAKDGPSPHEKWKADGLLLWESL